jgi:hypothetical protein
MEVDFQLLEQSFGPRMYAIAQTAREHAVTQGTSAKFNSGCWSNESGIFVAYVSGHFGMSNADRTLDGTIQVKVSSSLTKVIADVSWSDGEVIQEVAELQADSDTNDLVSICIALSESLSIAYIETVDQLAVD